MIQPTLFWYLAVSLIGLGTFPISFRMLSKLPDRGYGLSRALGLLLWGFLFWLLSSLGFLANNMGGYVFAFFVLGGISIWAWRSVEPGEIIGWLREKRGLVITVELLFAAAFVGWVIVRAANPAIQSTEKPMELAFINASMRAEFMPPHDPWLSGYAISYYYFGYVLTAMLANLTSTLAGEAFTLALALVFSLTAIGSYSIGYNLLAVFRPKVGRMNMALAMLSPIFMLLVSNAEGFLEILHAGGVFWSEDADGSLTSDFWEGLDIEDLRDPPREPLDWVPRDYETGGWSWWRASRVIQD